MESQQNLNKTYLTQVASFNKFLSRTAMLHVVVLVCIKTLRFLINDTTAIVTTTALNICLTL